MRRLRGWEPKQRITITERDAEGRPSQWTIETEPEFDATERQGWYALADYRDAICPSCGNLKSICSDPENDLYPQRRVCHVEASQKMIRRRVDAHFKQHEPSHKNGWVHPTDGWSIWMSLVDSTPDDDFGGALPLAEPDSVGGE